MTRPTEKDGERVEVSSSNELREWLAHQEGRTGGIWLVTYKKSDRGGRYIPYEAIVEELIASGWVDSQPRALDDARSMRRIAPRSEDSAWSKANRKRAEALVLSGRMRSAGHRAMEIAKSNGAWRRNEDAEALCVPADLAAALDVAGGRNAFDNFPPSSRRIILEWIASAKTAATRERRILEAAQEAAAGRRAHHYR